MIRNDDEVAILAPHFCFVFFFLFFCEEGFSLYLKYSFTLDREGGEEKLTSEGVNISIPFQEAKKERPYSHSALLVV